MEAWKEVDLGVYIYLNKIGMFLKKADLKVDNKRSYIKGLMRVEEVKEVCQELSMSMVTIYASGRQM